MARTAIHPGEHLADELKALGMSAAALSRDINVPVNRITGIINGTRAITADTSRFPTTGRSRTSMVSALTPTASSW
jgi:plasmid maintenance system antidote protein VapI